MRVQGNCWREYFMASIQSGFYRCCLCKGLYDPMRGDIVVYKTKEEEWEVYFECHICQNESIEINSDPYSFLNRFTTLSSSVKIHTIMDPEIETKDGNTIFN
jgi:hypothetical protein